MRSYTDIPNGTPACTKYNLVANIRHNENRKELIDQAETGYYNVHILHKVWRGNISEFNFWFRRLISGTIFKIC